MTAESMLAAVKTSFEQKLESAETSFTAQAKTLEEQLSQAQHKLETAAVESKNCAQRKHKSD